MRIERACSAMSFRFFFFSLPKALFPHVSMESRNDKRERQFAPFVVSHMRPSSFVVGTCRR